jgi:hypothetical protein
MNQNPPTGAKSPKGMLPTWLNFLASLFITGNGGSQISRADSASGLLWGVVQLGVGLFMLVSCALDARSWLLRRKGGEGRTGRPENDGTDS